MKLWLLVIVVLTQLCCAGCHVGRFFIYNFADIQDYKKFPSMRVELDPTVTPFTFATLPDSALLRPKVTIEDKRLSLQDLMKKTGTVALILIKNDTILMEEYRHPKGEEVIVPSFSVAKSFTSALVGIAIAEGHIKSVDQSIRDYVPELPEDPFQAITIEHLLEMRSGLKFNESYVNPFGHVATSYYGTNLKQFTKTLKAEEPPNKSFNYISINTQLLGWAVENATGKKLATYLAEKIWQPLQMEYDASWSLDSRRHQTAKAFCCINARARDFAKFGRLYLNYGRWGDQQVIPREWVEQSTDFTLGKSGKYRYQWWRRSGAYKTDFYAQGILGQYIYINREENVIGIRLGKRYGKMGWVNFFRSLTQTLASPDSE